MHRLGNNLEKDWIVHTKSNACNFVSQTQDRSWLEIEEENVTKDDIHLYPFLVFSNLNEIKGFLDRKSLLIFIY